MPTLNLARVTQILQDDEPPRVVVEPRKALSKGYLAKISQGRPGDAGPWRRHFVHRSGESFVPGDESSPGTTLYTYANLGDGVYEAHSTLRSGQAHRVVFRVAGGQIAVLSDGGTAEEVLGSLGWAAPAAPDDGLPELAGSSFQVQWGRTERAKILSAATAARRDDLVDRFRHVGDSTYFIANRNKPLDAWPEPGPNQFVEGKLAAGHLF